MSSAGQGPVTASIAGDIGRFILSARLAILLIFLVTIAGLIFFIPQFKINASADTLLTKNNELYIQTQLANQRFSPAEFVLVAYQPKNAQIFTQQSFDDLLYLSQSFEKLERVESINSILSVPLIESQSQLIGDTDVGSLNYKQQQYALDKMQSMLNEHPIYTDLLINKAQTATAIQVVFKSNPQLAELDKQIVDIQKERLNGELSGEQETELAKLKEQANVLQEKNDKVRQQEIEQIEALLFEVSERADTYIGGSYVVGIRLIEIVKQDLVYFGLAIASLISVLLLALFRSARWLLFPVFACSIAVAITMGILAVLKIPATVISANFVALQLILTLAIMLHLITCYREISRAKPDSTQHERIVATLHEKLAPCFYAAITTSVGFGSLIFSGIQPVIDFGIMMLIANGVTLCVALLLFPAILSYLKSQQESEEFSSIKRLLAGTKGLVERFTKTVIAIPFIVIAILSVGIVKLNVENSFIEYFHQDTTIYKELSFIDQEFGGSTPLDIIIDLEESKSSELFVDAETVNRLHLAHAAIDAFDATGNVTSLINFTKLARQLNDNKPLTEYELDAIYKLVDKEVIDSLIGAYVDTNTNTMRISTRIQDTLPNLNRAELLDNINADLQATGLKQNEYQLTNLFVLYQDILSRLLDSQINTLALVYLALGLILLAIFRSLKLALIALVPNVLTTAGILGVIAWAGIPLDLMTITTAAIAMGIAIDDTIHFMDAYLSGNPGEKLRGAFSHTGLAITYTSTLIAVGFGMFVFSDFMPSVYFGVLTACAMLFALITDLTLLPALLTRFVKDEAVQEAS